VLAWSNADRVACVINANGGGEVRIFTPPSPASASVVPIVGWDLARGGYGSDYLQNHAEQRRRAFSPEGRYFAFTTDRALYVSDLSAAGSAGYRHYSPYDNDVSAGAGAHIDLAFSANEKFILQHRGADLTVHELAQPSEYGLPLSDRGSMSDPDPCSEQYTGHTETWCGRPAGGRDFRWSPLSPNAPLVAFRSSSGALRVVEVTSGMKRDMYPLNVTCARNCKFEFQP